MRPLLILACLCAALTTAPARAADDVTDAIQTAYAPYRAALFRTNAKAQAESEQAIASTRQGWQAVIDRYGTKPPAPYDRDAAFASTLAEVAAVYARADTQIRERRLAEAHETLEQARDLIGELRRRNGVVAYSDHMNAYHAAMEHALADGPKQLGVPQGPLLLMARVGVLDHLAGRLRSEAPPALLRDAEFGPLLQAVEASVAALKAAVLGQDAAAVRQALGQLKGPYGKLFLRFG